MDNRISHSLDEKTVQREIFDEDDINTTPTQRLDMAEAQKKRFQKLFDRLDINKDGRIEASELAIALRATSGAISEEDVKVFAKVRYFACLFSCYRPGEGSLHRRLGSF